MVNIHGTMNFNTKEKSNDDVVESYLQKIYELRKESTDISGWYELHKGLQKKIVKEDKKRLNPEEKNTLLGTLDSFISSAEYLTIEDRGLSFSSDDGKIYIEDSLKSLYDTQIYVAKNKKLFTDPQFTKIMYGLDKAISELDYKRNIDKIIKNY